MSDSLELIRTYLADERYAIVELKEGAEPGRKMAVLRHMRGDPVGGQEIVEIPLRDAEDTEFVSGKVLDQ